MGPQLKVAVIGAGVSGLLTARELQREGHQVVVYEKSDRIGGIWVYDSRMESDPLSLDPNREIVHSSVYESLRTNLPRQLMGFSDYPFTITQSNGQIPDFPGHQEVLEFLNRFVEDFGLSGLVRFNAEVVRIEKEEGKGGLWVVESRLDCGLGSEETFDAVVVCNGHYTQPHLAVLPGIKQWPGQQIHSHNYRVPDPFRDKVVVVIGAGPSAHDISQEIAQVAREVHLSSRSPEVKVSKLDISNNMWQHSQVDYCHEDGEVTFHDGASIAADIILHCTGYKYDLPFLKTNGIVTVNDNRVGPLYKHVFPPELAPGLSFVGIPYRVAVFCMLEAQAKWVASALSGKADLPSKEEMLADVEGHYRRMEEAGVPKHQTHRLPVNSFEYIGWVTAQSGIAVDEQKKDVYQKFAKLLIDFTWPGLIRELDVESWIK